MLHVGCLLHWFDLLFEDVLKITFCAGVVETARAISKYFRSHTGPADLLQKHQKLQYKGKNLSRHCLGRLAWVPTTLSFNLL